MKKSLSRLIKNPKVIIWKIKTSYIPRIKMALRKFFSPVLAGKSQRGNIAMIHIGRSGSTILADLLGQDKDVHWDGEVLKDFLDGDKANSQWKTFLASRMSLAGKNRFYGAEFKFFHMELCEEDIHSFIEHLHGLGFEYFVILERKNYLRKIVSSVIADKTATWHAASGEGVKVTEIALDVNAVCVDKKTAPLLEFLDAYRADFNQLGEDLKLKQSLLLSYEEHILTSPTIAYEKICEFIGKNPIRVDVRYGRTNSAPLKSIILNYEDVDGYLSATNHYWMIND